MIRVVIADDHKIFRVGIRRIIEDEKDFTVVGEADNGREAIELCRRMKPHIAVLDFNMPEMNGLEAAREIRRELPDVKILILTVYDSGEHATRCLDAGAHGFLPKVISPEELPSAIRNIIAGRTHISFIKDECEKAAGQDTPLPSAMPISGREREVLTLLAQGCSVKEIALKLNLSSTTVRTHRGRLMAKLNLANNSEIVRYAMENSMI